MQKINKHVCHTCEALHHYNVVLCMTGSVVDYSVWYYKQQNISRLITCISERAAPRCLASPLFIKYCSCAEKFPHIFPPLLLSLSLFFPYIFPSSHWVLLLQQESSGIVFVCRGKDCVKESFSVCLWSWLHMLTKKSKKINGMTFLVNAFLWWCAAWPVLSTASVLVFKDRFKMLD